MQIFQGIRDKGAAIVIAVIALSLIGFILMDAKQQGIQIFGSRSENIGKVNSSSIGYEEFKKKADFLELQEEQQSGRKPDPARLAQIREQVWNTITAEKVCYAEADKLGIDFTSKELESILKNGYLQSVQNALQTSIGDDEGGKKNKLLKTQLLKKIQTSPANVTFSEMLIWQYIQEKDFESAFFQSKALEKRQQLQGAKILPLASLAAANKDYDIAIKCYQYIIDLGKNSQHYHTARMEMVNVLNTKITTNPAFTSADLMKLKSTYISTIGELGKSPTTLPLIKGLAHLEAFYLDRADTAIDILNEASEMPRADAKSIAECKLELADILLFTGEIWETTLLYSQVEKSFKEEPIGQDAKFRNARLCYYHGDF